MTRIIKAARNAAGRLRIERAVGAPWRMVRLYVRVEIKHALAGHEGDPQSCLRCYGLATEHKGRQS